VLIKAEFCVYIAKVDRQIRAQTAGMWTERGLHRVMVAADAPPICERYFKQEPPFAPKSEA
jgi:hypothetical protein